jgi:hypothetical protein
MPYSNFSGIWPGLPEKGKHCEVTNVCREKTYGGYYKTVMLPVIFTPSHCHATSFVHYTKWIKLVLFFG